MFGGIENSIFNLSLGLQRNGTRVTVYSSHLGSNDEEVGGISTIRNQEALPAELPPGNAERDHAIKVHLIRHRNRIAADIASVIHERDIDLILACDPLWGIVQFCETWKVDPCPTVLSFHVPNQRELLELAGASPYLFYRCVSPNLKEEIDKSVRLRDVEVIPNSFDPARFKPSVLPSEESKILFCNSRIDPAKGIDFLLHAFALFQRRIGGFELWLCAGQSPFGDRHAAIEGVKEEIRNLGLTRSVRMLGNLQWHEMPDYIRQSFAVVLPTLYESFGRAAMEALACGVPVVATRTGNLPYLIGDAGMLVESASPQALYEGLLKLYEHPELRCEYRLRGPVQVAIYNNTSVAASFIAAAKRRL